MPSNLPVLLAAGEPSFTPSSFMPSVMVEIAFNAGYVTPAADRVWTDVTDYVELANEIKPSVGRQDERSTADANQVTLTLDNTDGRFTAKRAASPYYPNVKVGRPIRVSCMVDGDTFIRFTGFVDEWPVEWDGTDSYAKATLRASSRLSRLGLGAKLRSMIEQEIDSSQPYRYWTMGDPSSSVIAAEASSQSTLVQIPDVFPLTYQPVVFGSAVGPGSDDLTAAQFTSGGTHSSYLLSTAENFSLASGPRSLRVWALVTNPSPFGFTTYITLFDSGMTLSVTAGGLIQGGGGTTGPNIADGSGHDLHLVRDGVDELLYVDGVQVDTNPAGAPAAASSISFGETMGATMVLAHAAVYDYALTPTQVAAQADAVLTGAAGEATDERLLRILGWAGVAATEVDAEAGTETMTYQLTSGQSVVDALRDVESTEGGVLFDGPDGNVKFHNRSRRYLATPAITLDMESQHVGADYAPRVDRSALVNDVIVSNPTTGETARAVDTASSDEYGIATGSAASVADSYDPLQQKAAWLVASYAEPGTRVPSLTVDVLAHRGLTPSAQDLLGIGVGDLIAVVNAPTQADTTDTSYFVEGYTETIGPESWFITFNLSPTYPTLDTFVLDSATRGLLDTNLLGY